jgi:hypothetical protein
MSASRSLLSTVLPTETEDPAVFALHSTTTYKLLWVLKTQWLRGRWSFVLAKDWDFQNERFAGTIPSHLAIAGANAHVLNIVLKDEELQDKLKMTITTDGADIVATIKGSYWVKNQYKLIRYVSAKVLRSEASHILGPEEICKHR